MRSERHEGFTLAELLVVVAIFGIAATMAMPLLSSGDPTKLDVAAQETGNALRFAVNEARRSGGYILVDAKTTAGHLKVVKSDVSGADLGAVNDPLTKRALDIDTKGSAFSGTVSMTPKFIGGVTPYAQLLIGPKCCIGGPTAELRAFDGPSADMGLLQPGSGIAFSLGSIIVTVLINESTGFVTIPSIGVVTIP